MTVVVVCFWELASVCSEVPKDVTEHARAIFCVTLHFSTQEEQSLFICARCLIENPLGSLMTSADSLLRFLGSMVSVVTISEDID